MGIKESFSCQGGDEGSVNNGAVHVSGLESESAIQQRGASPDKQATALRSTLLIITGLCLVHSSAGRKAGLVLWDTS